MQQTTLADRLRGGETIVSAWLSLPDLSVAELVQQAGFGTLTIDMQHGRVDLASAFRLVAQVRQLGGTPVVRIPVGENQTASRLLDAGAAMVIAPMITCTDDAARFGAFMKYPPMGARSWGPGRAVQLLGGTASDYALGANRTTLAVPMIETRSALEALDAILALDTVDGVFVGPGDLSIALSGRVPIDLDAPDTMAAIADIGRRTEMAGKFSAIYALNGEYAKKYIDLGFRFVTVSSDVNYILNGAKAALASVMPVAGRVTATGGY
jgi:4-hydroxy-2-oxoheptanedioate aldolase